MDLLTIFENKLKTDEQATDEFAKKWDQRAERFYAAQQTGRKTLKDEKHYKKLRRKNSETFN